MESNMVIRICLFEGRIDSVYKYNTLEQKARCSLELLNKWFGPEYGFFQKYSRYFDPPLSNKSKKTKKIRTTIGDGVINMQDVWRAVELEPNTTPLRREIRMDYNPGIQERTIGIREQNNIDDQQIRYDKAIQIEADIKSTIRNNDGEAAISLVNEIMHEEPICQSFNVLDRVLI